MNSKQTLKNCAEINNLHNNMRKTRYNCGILFKFALKLHMKSRSRGVMKAYLRGCFVQT